MRKIMMRNIMRIIMMLTLIEIYWSGCSANAYGQPSMSLVWHLCHLVCSNHFEPWSNLPLRNNGSKREPPTQGTLLSARPGPVQALHLELPVDLDELDVHPHHPLPPRQALQGLLHNLR